MLWGPLNLPPVITISIWKSIMPSLKFFFLDGVLGSTCWVLRGEQLQTSQMWGHSLSASCSPHRTHDSKEDVQFNQLLWLLKKTWFLNKIPTVHENVNKKVRSHPKPQSEIAITKTPFYLFIHICGLPQWLSSKESACNAGDVGSSPGLGRFSGRWHGKPLQYSCLENPMDREAWWATAHRVTKSQTWLSKWARARARTHTHTHTHTHVYKMLSRVIYMLHWCLLLSHNRKSTEVTF